jgi:hypothetical protein
VSQIIADTMDEMSLKLPPTHVEIADIRRKFHAACTDQAANEVTDLNGCKHCQQLQCDNAWFTAIPNGDDKNACSHQQNQPKTKPLKRNQRISAVTATRRTVIANIVAPVFRKTLPENRRLPEFFFVATRRLISQGARIL